MTVGERIKARRVSLGLSVNEIATKLNKDRATIYRYESNDIENLPIAILEPLAVVLNTTPARLMGWEDNIEISAEEICYFDIIGSISAGFNTLLLEDYTGEKEPIPKEALHGNSPDDFFVLKVKGNSMYPKFLGGDKVLVYRCASVDSGSIAVILYNGEEATLKKVRYVPGQDWVELIPINPEYETKRIEGAELEQCRVLGKVVKLIRDI